MFDKYLFAGPPLTMWYREDFEQMGPCWFPLYLTLIYVILNCSDLWRYLPSCNRPSIETCFRQAVGNLKVFPESFISLKILSKYVYWFLETEKEKEGERKRERESEKEREKHQCVRETFIGCFPCVPGLGIEPPTFWCAGWCSNQLSHTSQGLSLLFLNNQLKNQYPKRHISFGGRGISY